MVLAHDVAGVLTPLPVAHRRGQRHHVGLAVSQGRVPTALRTQRNMTQQTGRRPGSSRELNAAPAQIHLIRTAVGPHKVDPAAAPNGGSRLLWDCGASPANADRIAGNESSVRRPTAISRRTELYRRCPLAGGSGDVGGCDIGGVPVQAAASPLFQPWIPAGMSIGEPRPPGQLWARGPPGRSCPGRQRAVPGAGSRPALPGYRAGEGP
jgi:hypothetical protein